MRYRLRTLLILMAIGPPMLWFGWWQWTEYRALVARRENLKRSLDIEPTGRGVFSIITEPNP